MRPILRGGLILGVVVAAWTLVMGVTGWFLDPRLQSLFMLVVVLQIAVLVVTLRATARLGRGYGGQVAAGLMTSAIGAVIIFVNSLVFTTILFPRYFEDLRAMQQQLLLGEGLSDEQIRKVVEESSAMQTPFAQAAAGFVGTVITGLVVSAVIAIFVRDKTASKK